MDFDRFGDQILETYTYCTHSFKQFRCNPDVAPRLTSGGYEDKVDVITPIPINQHIVHRGWWILIPYEDKYEDKVDVITPTNILFRGGGRILIAHEDKVDVITLANMLFRGGGKF